jgi:hypothetical protein
VIVDVVALTRHPDLARIAFLVAVMVNASACGAPVPPSGTPIPSPASTPVPDRIRAAVCVAAHSLADVPGDLTLFDEDAAASDLSKLTDDLAGVEPSISIAETDLAAIPPWPAGDQVTPAINAALDRVDAGLQQIESAAKANDAAKVKTGVDAFHEALGQLNASTAALSALETDAGVACPA